jgi:putative DNA primase/helicase
MTLPVDDLASVKIALARLAEPLLVELFGKPTSKRRRELRWGGKGSLSFSFDKMAIYDHEQGRGGSLLDAIQIAHDCSFDDALAFARQWLGTTKKLGSLGTLSAHLETNSSAVRSDTATLAINVWNEAEVIVGTLGQDYLNRRGLRLPDGAEMRFHPRCPRADRVQPAVIVLMRDIVSNQPRAIQRRFLLPDAAKDGPALSLGPTSGTVWKLTPDEDVTLGLGIAEGHADALAILNDGFSPIWATAGTVGMRSFPVLPGIEALTIFADRGEPGRDAAEQCRARWRATGRDANILPPLRGHDFAEQVEARR